MEKQRLIEICEQVAKDVENDAKEFDRKPFDGKTVATYFGYHGAAIKALAEVLKKILQADETKIIEKPDDSVCICGSQEPYKPSSLKGYEVCTNCFISRKIASPL